MPKVDATTTHSKRRQEGATRRWCSCCWITVADVNAEGSQGTALQAALENKHEKVVQLLQDERAWRDVVENNNII